MQEGNKGEGLNQVQNTLVIPKARRGRNDRIQKDAGDDGKSS